MIDTQFATLLGEGCHRKGKCDNCGAENMEIFPTMDEEYKLKKELELAKQ